MCGAGMGSQPDVGVGNRTNSGERQRLAAIRCWAEMGLWDFIILAGEHWGYYCCDSHSGVLQSQAVLVFSQFVFDSICLIRK